VDVFGTVIISISWRICLVQEMRSCGDDALITWLNVNWCEGESLRDIASVMAHGMVSNDDKEGVFSGMALIKSLTF